MEILCDPSVTNVSCYHSFMGKNTRTEGLVCKSLSREKQVLAILDRMQFQSNGGKGLRHDVSAGSLSVDSSGSPIQHRDNGSHRAWEGLWCEFWKMEGWIRCGITSVLLSQVIIVSLLAWRAGKPPALQNSYFAVFLLSLSLSILLLIRWFGDYFPRVGNVLLSYMYWVLFIDIIFVYVILFRTLNNFFSKSKPMQDSFRGLVNLGSLGLTLFILGMLLCVATFMAHLIYFPGCERWYVLRVWCMKFIRSYSVRSTGFGMAVMLVSAVLGHSVVKNNVTIEQGIKLTLILSLCAVVASFVRGIVGWVNTVEKDRLELMKKLEEYSEMRGLRHENLNKLDVAGLLSGLQNIVRTVELCQRTVVLGYPWVALVPEVLVEAFVVTQVQWLTQGYAVDEFISPKEGVKSEINDAFRAFFLDLKKRSRSFDLYEYVRCELSRSADEKNGQPNSFKLGDELIVVNLMESTLRVPRCLG